jgi:hypothetical protein
LIFHYLVCKMAYERIQERSISNMKFNLALYAAFSFERITALYRREL